MDIKDIKLSTITDSIVKFLHRFHIVIFIVISLGGLAFVVFSLYQTTIEASDTSQVSQNEGAVNFDQQTIDKLDQLKDPKESPTVKLPKGRISPFVE